MLIVVVVVFRAAKLVITGLIVILYVQGLYLELGHICLANHVLVEPHIGMAVAANNAQLVLLVVMVVLLAAAMDSIW